MGRTAKTMSQNSDASFNVRIAVNTSGSISNTSSSMSDSILGPQHGILHSTSLENNIQHTFPDKFGSETLLQQSTIEPLNSLHPRNELASHNSSNVVKTPLLNSAKPSNKNKINSCSEKSSNSVVAL